jgi:hypothetical protein
MTLNEVNEYNRNLFGFPKKKKKMSTVSDEASVGAGSAQTMQVTLECWAKFGLDGRRITLDSQAARIAESQDTAVRSRRELTEQTKVRKKLF